MAIQPNASASFSGTASSVGASTAITITTMKRVRLTRVKILRVSGTAATLTPRLVSASGAAAGSFEEEWTALATPVATKIDEHGLDLPITTDANNSLYLIFAPDAGSDNVIQYALYFDLLSGS